MVKNICLYGLVSCPGLIITENVYFKWYPFFSRLEMPDQECHILVNFRVVLQVLLNIFAERTEISHSPAIHQYGVIDILVLIIFLNLCKFFINVLVQVLYFPEFTDQCIITEPDSVHIDIYGSLDPPSP